MGTNGNSSPNNTATHNAIVKPVLLPEIGPDGIARESPVIAYTEKVFLLFLWFYLYKICY